jgi:hypothetical protein
MADNTPNAVEQPQEPQVALANWDDEGGAGRCGPQKGPASGEIASEAPELTTAELVNVAPD